MPGLGSNPPEIHDVDMEGSMAPELQDIHAGADDSAPEREGSHGAGNLGARTESEDPAEPSEAQLVEKNIVIVLPPPPSAEQHAVETPVSTSTPSTPPKSAQPSPTAPTPELKGIRGEKQ